LTSDRKLRSQRLRYGSASVFALILAVALPLRGQASQKTHTITVRFDYDFTTTHACPVKGKATCIRKFNVYNLTDTGQRILLFSIPAPDKAKKKVQGISGTSKALVFAPGQHMVAVSAVDNHGAESNPRACATMVNIAP
jgi:hypothetical protein